MLPDIRSTPVEFTVHGFSLLHDPAKKFGEEIMALLGRVWPVVKGNSLPHDGVNRVVYDAAPSGAGECMVFAGVVLGTGAEAMTGASELERKTVRLTRYAVWKHVGPYHLIPVTGAAMRKALEVAGHRMGWPMVEVYGHWTSDESKLETETWVKIV